MNTNDKLDLALATLMSVRDSLRGRLEQPQDRFLWEVELINDTFDRVGHDRLKKRVKP